MKLENLRVDRRGTKFDAPDGDLPRHPDDAAPGPGEYRCLLCSSRVTVGPLGNEYGHAKASEDNVATDCPRRGTQYNPDRING